MVLEKFAREEGEISGIVDIAFISRRQ